MSDASIARQPRPRRSMPAFLAGCLTGSLISIALCAVLAIAINAAYWTYALGPVQSNRGAATGQTRPPPQSTEALRNAVATLPAGNADSGARIFQSVAHCNACHAIAGSSGGVGPALDGIRARAATTRPGYSAEMYLYESIVDPGAFAAEGQRAGIMPANFGQRMSDQELADLVAYLMTR